MSRFTRLCVVLACLLATATAQTWIAERDCPALCDQACECVDSSHTTCAQACGNCLVQGIPCGTTLAANILQQQPQQPQQPQQTTAPAAKAPTANTEPRLLEVGATTSAKTASSTSATSASTTAASSSSPAAPPGAAIILTSSSSQGGVPVMQDSGSQQTGAPKRRQSSGRRGNKDIRNTLDQILAIQEQLVDFIEKDRLRSENDMPPIGSLQPLPPMPGREPNYRGSQPMAGPGRPLPFDMADTVALPQPFGRSPFTTRLHRSLGTPRALTYHRGELWPRIHPSRRHHAARIIRHLENLVDWAEDRAASGEMPTSTDQRIDMLIGEAVRMAKESEARDRWDYREADGLDSFAY